MNKLERILEAKSDLTPEEILNKLDSLHIPGSEEEEDAEKQSTVLYFKNYRNMNLFTRRPGEEDDDYPDFIGWNRVRKLAENHFSQWIKEKKIKILVEPSEKMWFAVGVKVL